MIRRRRTITVAMVAAGLAMFGGAATANAQTPDEQFVSAMTKMGIPFATRESSFDSNGERRISFTPLITGKGQQWLVERLIRDGILRGVAA